MNVLDIARELYRNEKQKQHCDKEIVQLLEDICNGKESSANWFLRQALLFIEQNGFDVSSYSLNWYATNEEADPNVSIYLWVLDFIKNENEFILEVNQNRSPAVIAKKWVKTRAGRSSTRRVSHIKTAVNQ